MNYEIHNRIYHDKMVKDKTLFSCKIDYIDCNQKQTERIWWKLMMLGKCLNWMKHASLYAFNAANATAEIPHR